MSIACGGGGGGGACELTISAEFSLFRDFVKLKFLLKFVMVGLKMPNYV